MYKTKLGSLFVYLITLGKNKICLLKLHQSTIVKTLQLLYNIVQYNKVQCNMKQYNIKQRHWYNMIQYNTKQPLNQYDIIEYDII